MIRILMSIAAMASLVACGDGNPFSAAADDSSDDSTDNFYGADLNADLTMNNLSYDATADELIINNLPFDRDDGRYTHISGVSLSNNFQAYESELISGSGSGYYAVFRRSASGYSQAAAVASNRYVGYGFGGATAQRLNTLTTLPTTGVYGFTGEYAALRVSDAGVHQFVSGDASMVIDMDDFDTTGAVEGVILDRKLYDSSGAYLSDIAGYISLATAGIDFDAATTTVSTATEYDGVGDDIASGKWKSVFAGPDGEELAGILVIENSTDKYRETGAFVTKD